MRNYEASPNRPKPSDRSVLLEKIKLELDFAQKNFIK